MAIEHDNSGWWPIHNSYGYIEGYSESAGLACKIADTSKLG